MALIDYSKLGKNAQSVPQEALLLEREMNFSRVFKTNVVVTASTI